MSEKKKILQVGYASFAKAGIQTVIMNIARGVYKDFDIDVLLTSNKPGYYDEEFEQYGNIYRVNCSVEGFGKLKKYLHFAITVSSSVSSLLTCAGSVLAITASASSM